MKKLTTTLHYCRSKKSTGKPIIVTIDNKRKFVKKWERIFYNEAGDEVLVRMAFNNSEGMAKRQGATTVLQIWE